MPTLNWIGKEAVEKHHLEIPYRLLEYDDTYSAGDLESGNLLIQGDNLHALKALLPYYAGKIKCIYIDPPYNTGNENWRYNDNVNAPEIKKWLNEVVGKEGEDLTRHDKWLCMMYPRLQLLKKLLSKDGVIFISIDDFEQSTLKILMDEIFGKRNFVTNIIWQKKTGASDAIGIATITEYVLCYVKDVDYSNQIFSKNLESYDLKRYRYKDEHFDTRGPYYVDNLDRGGLQYSDSLNFGINGPDKKILFPNGRDSFENDGWIWKWSKAKVEWALKNNFIEFRKSKSKKTGWAVCYKNYLLVNNENKPIVRSAPMKNLIQDVLNANSAADIKSIFGQNIFKYSKPKELIKRIINYVNCSANCLILDSFSGSGTTGQSVLEINKEDNGNRKFILIELEEDIAKNVTAERLKRVINGYEVKKQNGTLEKVEGLGGGFRYCKLAEPLFDQFGNVREGVTFKQLAYHIFFSETGVPLKENARLNTPLIGKYKGKALYLLFNGILGDKSVNGGNVLTSKVLDALPKYNGEKIIFGMANRISANRLKKEQITFKQIPVEIKTS
ncbi:MAG: site-specific DNA-methyltransferase [Melioribacteraceae bacterium]|nr:site-specific DNA-methyltransferase [Melioribacteraceae bacterium]